MGRLRRYLGLPAAERRLFHRALAAVVRVRVRLWLLPFAVIRRQIDHESAPRSAPRQLWTPEQIARAVRRAGRCVPRASCLVLALAARELCAEAGHPTRVHVGVRPGGKFAAHAWLECAGRVLLGGEDADDYAPLLTLGERQT
ncbi:MAG: lasso peptide biosynthesis B2 protein [Acidobacteriia bacterium]|jgi:hypothetical protein|nr:lasso peptide biosynthesis B2 protein [Terriglobia bacterium]